MAEEAPSSDEARIPWEPPTLAKLPAQDAEIMAKSTHNADGPAYS